MTEEEKEAYAYRFSGYNLPMLQLDSTGPAYPIVEPHPYLRDQPTYWQGPIYYGHPNGPLNLTVAKDANQYPFDQNDENT